MYTCIHNQFLCSIDGGVDARQRYRLKLGILSRGAPRGTMVGWRVIACVMRFVVRCALTFLVLPCTRKKSTSKQGVAQSDVDQ